MTTLDDLTQAHRANTEARIFSQWLTALVKHPEHRIDQANYFNAVCRTKAAVEAVTTGDFSVFARQFLTGPAGARVLNRLGAFSAPRSCRCNRRRPIRGGNGSLTASRSRS